MTYDEETLLTTILRRVLVATDDVAILADVRGLQRKVKGLGADPHDLAISGGARARHSVMKRAIAARNEAETLSRMWEAASKEVLADLAKDRGGRPPEGYTWKNDKRRRETPEEVAERHIKRLVWEIKQVTSRHSKLRSESVAKDARIAELEARLATIAMAVAA